MSKYLFITYFFLFSTTIVVCQKIPSVYSNIYAKPDGKIVVKTPEGQEFEMAQSRARYTMAQVMGNPVVTDSGLIVLDFKNEHFNGKLYYGFIDYENSIFEYPVFFKSTANIANGKATIDLNKLRGKYDMVKWQQKGIGTLGYRISDENGVLIYDGRITFYFENQIFKLGSTLTLGPLVGNVTSNSVTIAFETLKPEIASLTINNQTYKSTGLLSRHEFVVNNLKPATLYQYQVNVGKQTLKYHVKTNPNEGARQPFTFAYASDSRNGQGGGERNLHGANYYIMKRIMALATQQNAVFLQFTGDLINGYLKNGDEQRVQYQNWFRAIEPFAHYLPVYIGFGNHEALTNNFPFPDSDYGLAIDQWPFETHSAEKVFADFVLNPINGPKSEDGASYDPNLHTTDFPPYSENVFSYTHDNVAVIVMNSDYWYSPTLYKYTFVGGGLHGYIMDNQLNWVKDEIAKFENNKNIDHIFITEHTPFFPNGGHVDDDMWYNGNNKYKPYVAGKPLEKGIIERRDELLNLFINQSTKVRAILTGDEHNYNKTEIGPNTIIYPDKYEPQKITLSRTIYQINNGSAGAPYYAQEQTPWTPMVSNFSTQYALVLFDVNGKNIHVRVINPDTFEKIDEFVLYE